MERSTSRPGEFKHDLCQAFAKFQHVSLLRFFDQGEADSKQDTEDNNLQDLAIGNGLGNILRKNMKDDFIPPEGGGTSRVSFPWWVAVVYPHLPC